MISFRTLISFGRKQPALNAINATQTKNIVFTIILNLITFGTYAVKLRYHPYAAIVNTIIMPIDKTVRIVYENSRSRVA